MKLYYVMRLNKLIGSVTAPDTDRDEITLPLVDGGSLTLKLSRRIKAHQRHVVAGLTKIEDLRRIQGFKESGK